MLDSTISVLHKNGLRESNEAFQNLAADSKNFNKDIMDWTIFNQSEIGNILLVVRPSCHCCSHRRPSTVAFCSVHTWIEPTLIPSHFSLNFDHCLLYIGLSIQEILTKRVMVNF